MGKFVWMPAAMAHGTVKFDSTNIHVKYKQNSSQDIVIKYSGPKAKYYECPDRDILITSDIFLQDPVFSAGQAWDQIVTPSVYNYNLYDHSQLPYFMCNFTDVASLENGCNLRAQADRLPTDPVIVSDSGGFQMLTGVEDFIDPVRLTQWASAHADLLMALDVPCDHQDMPLDKLKALAHLQNLNTDVILANKSDRLSLINILHGGTPEKLDAYRKIVERKHLTKIALGGNPRNPISFADRTMHVLAQGQLYEHMHVLGVLTPKLVALMAYAARSPRANQITSDSSSATLSATNLAFATWDADSPLNYTQFKKRYDYNLPSIKNILPCNCPTCTAIKYADVIGTCSNAGRFDAGALTAHNLYVSIAYSQFLSEQIVDTSSNHARKFIQHHFRKDKNLNDLLTAVDYIEAVNTTSYEKARHKFRSVVNKAFNSRPSNLVETQDNCHFDIQVEQEAPVISISRYNHILDLYRNYYKERGVDVSCLKTT